MSSSVKNAMRLPPFVEVSLRSVRVAEEEDARTVALAARSAGGGDAQWLDDGAVARQRMAGDVEPEHLLLEGEALIGRPTPA